MNVALQYCSSCCYVNMLCGKCSFRSKKKGLGKGTYKIQAMNAANQLKMSIKENSIDEKLGTL